jgi:hypothetical protein
MAITSDRTTSPGDIALQQQGGIGGQAEQLLDAGRYHRGQGSKASGRGKQDRGRPPLRVTDADYLTRFLETNILIVIILPVVQCLLRQEKAAHALRRPCRRGSCSWELCGFSANGGVWRRPCYIRVLFFLKG